MTERFIGIDLGAETLKLAELRRTEDGLELFRHAIVEHHKQPEPTLLNVLRDWDWDGISGATASGRCSRNVELTRIPTKQAQAAGCRFLLATRPATVVSIGSHGFSVLEMRPSGVEVFRENSRCSQGTGNFLRQLVERFGLSVDEASALSAGVEDPAPLSGRCPVILKTDMTHLANKGEKQNRILAGLYDAVCENVQVLIKPRISPPEIFLCGGVARAPRIRDNFARFAERHEMALVEAADPEAFLLVEAIGCAVLAAAQPAALPKLERLVTKPEAAKLERLPAFADYRSQVKRLGAPPLLFSDSTPPSSQSLILGFDIGSTGSKAVALDCDSREMVWQAYTNTSGNPVAAAQSLLQQFVDGPAGACDIIAFGATGSGREIVGSLLATAYGPSGVFVLNEIAAHAEGALFYDSRVDTIFEIGGQDAKYIRLSAGRVVDAAMNEACSAGTGSFIEEQGSKFSGVNDVTELGQEGLRASCGVSLGQHCSVFMAEIIDEAVAAGVDNRAIIAGIYDSIIQNYLNRVKGSRSVGEVIFCQGMPFSADALACAVARQTGSEVVVPPNPGTVGALGIALLTHKAARLEPRPALDPQRFLAAELEAKDTFVCKSQKGCGGSGNRCRIDRIRTQVGGDRLRFTWGGGCSLWDRGTGRTKLPDLAPDPFREREELVADLNHRLAPRGNPRVALTDEFVLKGTYPFFARFLYELGFDLAVTTGGGQAAIKRGVEAANVPFCAPMQQYHGLVSAMAEEKPDYLFLPMMRGVPRSGEEERSVVCPVVQGSAEVLRHDLPPDPHTKIISPVVDLNGADLESQVFRDSCAKIAALFSVNGKTWKQAYNRAVREQNQFDDRCHELGRAAVSYCAAHGITPVVVLGRSYTIYNTALNSNVPAILREQGAIGIPVDCYPVDDSIPFFHDVYWGYGQRNLRAVTQIRSTPGLYSLWCSNYSCGPDSFNLHFFSYLMAGKPFAVIETDGHSGDAGTKTRVEAFLHCVREDQTRGQETDPAPDPGLIARDKGGLRDFQSRNETLLIPRMGEGAEVLAATMRGVGISSETLPMPDHEAVRIGRRHTSGKECLPMTVTLGSLLQRLEAEQDPDHEFVFFMPTAGGPCRFGVYNLLHKITLDRLNLRERVRIWSPADSNYFDGIPGGVSALVFTGFTASDLLLAALYDVRPVERVPGAAQALYEQYSQELYDLVEAAGKGDLRVPAALLQVANGRLFGVADLLRRAAADFSGLKRDVDTPSVLVVGEIYVRCDSFSNGFVIDELERRGIRARFAPFGEWLEYTDHLNVISEKAGTGFSTQLSSFVRRRTLARLYGIVAEPLAWPERTPIREILKAGSKYIREDLVGEAILTVGGPLYEYEEGLIDGVVSVGPLECMPTKLAESQFFHAAEQEGLLSLTIPLNGDPVDPEILDNFAFEIHAHHKQREKPVRRVSPRPRFALPFI